MSEKLKDWHEMLPIVRRIYERSGVGCCWHVVLDDGNYDCAESCAKYAKQNAAQCVTRGACLELVPLALRASETQLGKVARAKRSA